ncbi:hypothetical protein [Pseudooceanicola sp. MF1-13]|uniref:hypothetical protein n=1 Tax=Pseudooceanicola sp. MF1-13 TaxID=3379095 RepID=UPI00389274F1
MVAPRLHVVGSSPRSGTTLMFELLCYGFDVTRLGDHEHSLFDRPPVTARPAASKTPNDFVHVKRLLPWDRHLHCLFMDRDPRDCIVSRHGQAPDRYWCDFETWAKNHALIDRLGPHPRVLVCRYETLVTDPDRVQDQIASAFPFLRTTRRFSTFGAKADVSDATRLALKGARPVTAASRGAWRQNLPRIAAQLAEFPEMADQVVRAGYDTPGWTRICDGIPPDPALSVRAEHDPLRQRSGAAWVTARIARRLGSLGKELRYAAHALRENS